MKTHLKTLIMLLIVCVVFSMIPAFALTGPDPSATAANDQSAANTDIKETLETDGEQDAAPSEEPAVTGEKDTPAEEAAADSKADSKAEGATEKDVKGTGAEGAAEESAEKHAEESTEGSKDKESQEKDPDTAEEKDTKETEPEKKTSAPKTVTLKKVPMLASGEGESLNYTASRNEASNAIVFEATMNGQKYKGTCNECGVAFKSSGTMTVVALGKNDLRRKVAYKYGDWLENDDRNYDMGGLYKGVCLEAMMQYARAWMDDKDDGGSANRTDVVNHWKKSTGNGGNGWASATCDALKDAVTELNGKTATQLNIPDKFRAYHGEVKNSTSDGRVYGQDPVFWGDLVTGAIKVTKVPESGNEEYVAAHPDEFDLSGAQYQLWTNKACTKKATDVNWNNAVLTTKADGTTNKLTMEVGDYYLTEIQKPAKGYGLEIDKTTGKAAIHKETIKKDKTTTASYEEPVDITKVYVKKVDGSGKALSGAKLRIYDGNTAVGAEWTSDGKDHEIEGLTQGKTYTLRELSAPAGYDIADDVSFVVNAAETTTVTMKNIPVTVGTAAKSASTNNQRGVRKPDEKITDTVTMTGLVTGRSYKLVGKLMSKKTGQMVKDKNNNDVTVTTDPFQATEATMTKSIDFVFDSEKLAENDSVVAFETLYRTTPVNGETVPATGVELAKHEDINDTAQTVTYPDVPVTVKKMDTAAGKALSGAKLQIVQGSTVKAEWTTDGKDHVIRNLEAGDYILREISAPYSYETADDVKFSFDGVNAKTVTMNDAPVTVRTTAVSKSTGRHIGLRKAGEVITDTVHMTGLISGRKYKLTGQLINKENGSAIKGSSASKEFTATADVMDVPVDLALDPALIAGDGNVVASETLYRISKVHSETVPLELQKHHDLNDAGQTVIYPLISTTASIQKDNREVKDIIEYKNLLPDMKYVFKGWLVDTVTGEKVPESDGRTEMKTGSETSGKAEMILKTDKYDSMSGHSMTAFEELYMIENVNGTEKEILIAEHKDQKDGKQTVEIFQDLKIKKNVTGNLGDLTKVFEYTVEFTGLVPGSPYTIEGDDEKTFMADASGKASAALKLRDDQSAVIKKLPKGATYIVTEAASDHIAEYRVFSENMEGKGAKVTVKEASNGAEAAKMLSTAKETVDLFDGTIVVLWENNRDLATLTGLPTYTGIWAAGLAIALAGAIVLIARRKSERRMI